MPGKGERLRIGIDLDGVLADWVYEFTRLMASMFPEIPGLPVTAREQYTLRVKDYPGVPPGAYEATWDALTRTPNWWEGLPAIPTPWELAGLRETANRHDVVMVTARDMMAPAGGRPLTVQTRRWLESHGLGDVGLVFAKDKIPVIRAAGLDLFYDDEERHVVGAAALDPAPAVYLQDRPYNRLLLQADSGNGFRRVANVAEFLGWVEVHEREA